MRRQSRKVIFFVLISLFFSCGVGFCAQQDPALLSGKDRKFNVVLIILHAFPASHLGCYGYPENTSPAIDALSRDGATFNNAFCQIPQTLPSMVSMYTSLYPSSHRVLAVYKDKMPEKVYTLAEVLKIYGYSTAWFGSIQDPFMGGDIGLLKGFDEIYQTDYKREDRISPWIKKHAGTRFFLTAHEVYTHPKAIPFYIFDNRFSRRVPKEFVDEIHQKYKDAWVQAKEKLKNSSELTNRLVGEEWIPKGHQFPFYPYVKPFRDSFQGQGSWEKWLKAAYLFTGPTDKFLETLEGQRLQYYLWLLDSVLSVVDHDYVGQVVDTLKKEGLYDKTIIIVTADHGNEYKEHGSMGHGYTLYDETLRIPMIFYVPGLHSGRRIDPIVESVDILPTLCDLLGIPIPYQAQGDSLRKFLEGKFEGGEDRYTISQSMGTNLGAIRTSRWKLIMYQRGAVLKELYDIQKDPKELQNVISSNPQVAQNLRRQYIAKIRSLPSYQNNKSAFLPDVDEETRKRIQQTGYF